MAQLKTNLPSVLLAAKSVDAEIIIVDDNSNLDDSQKYLKSLGNKIRYYQSRVNQGYSFTVNRGVELARGDIVILLNTDVQVDPRCFVEAVKYFKDSTVYAVGFNSGEAWMGGEWQGGLFHHFKASSPKQNQNPVNPSLWASGGQAAFSRVKWLELGGMDLMYKPFYWEDTDMGYRAWKRGWQILWASDCQVVHKHGESVIAAHFTKQFIMTTALRNQFLFVWKNISDPSFLISHLIRLPYFLLRYPGPLLQAISLLPAALSGRRRDHVFWKRRDHDILSAWTR